MSTDFGASCTSVYTKVERQATYESLSQVLLQHCASEPVRQVILDLLNVCADITQALRATLVHVEGGTNDFGDTLLSVDVIADKLIWDAVKKSTVIREGSSEEDPIVRNVEEKADGDDTASKAEFTVCWDPLDGSSIVDNNWAVGTMVGVWPRRTGLLGATGRDQVTSIVALYGPRTTALVALDDGVYEFSYGTNALLRSDGTPEPWICSRHKISIAKESRIFSPANIRAAQELPGYQAWVDHHIKERRSTLRYTGGMVPDVYQQFTKHQGVFANPTSAKAPAKLRLAFEAAPFGLLVERAGGKTSDGVTGGSILDVRIKAVDQRTALCLGSAKEVDKFNDLVVK